MFEELRIFLIDNVSPEVYDLINQAFEIFDDIYPPNLRDRFEEILYTQDESLVDTGTPALAVVALTRQYLLNILKEHSITLNEDIDLNRLVKFVQALLDIQEYEDHETIINILNLDIDKEEKFAEIISLVTEFDASELLLEIEAISSSLLDRIREHIKTEPQNSVIEETVDYSLYVKNLLEYREFVKHEPLKIFDLIIDGLKPGYPFEIYGNIIGREFEAMDSLAAAKELLGMALISADGNGNPKSKIAEHIDKYVADFRKITQIDIKITDLLLKLQIFKDQHRENAVDQ